MPNTIKATPENADQIRDVVAHWPELAQTIKGLREQGVFPGLRCLTFTLEEGATLESLAAGAAAEKVNSKTPP